MLCECLEPVDLDAFGCAQPHRGLRRRHAQLHLDSALLAASGRDHEAFCAHIAAGRSSLHPETANGLEGYPGVSGWGALQLLVNDIRSVGVEPTDPLKLAVTRLQDVRASQEHNKNGLD